MIQGGREGGREDEREGGREGGRDVVKKTGLIGQRRSRMPGK